jgi:hypothetical protein
MQFDIVRSFVVCLVIPPYRTVVKSYAESDRVTKEI